MKYLRIVGVVIVLCCLLAAGLSVAAAGSEADLEEVLAALRARQEQVESLRYEWTQVHYRAANPEGPEGTVRPESEHTERCRLLLSGNDARYEWEGQSWNTAEEDYHGGEQRFSYVGGDALWWRNTTGTADRVPRPYFVHDPVVRPLLDTYRPVASDLALWDPDSLRIVGTGERDGHPCVIVEAVERPGGCRDRLWLAQDMEHVPLRIEFDDDGLTVTTDLEYAPDEESGWRLSSWHVVMDHGTFVQVWDCTVTKAQLNVPVSRSELEL